MQRQLESDKVARQRPDGRVLAHLLKDDTRNDWIVVAESLDSMRFKINVRMVVKLNHLVGQLCEDFFS